MIATKHLKRLQYLFCLCFLLSFFLNSRAQGDQQIEFDSSGRMISFPKRLVHSSDVVSFCVKIPKAVLDSQWDSFGPILQKANKFLNTKTVQAAYNYMFGAPPSAGDPDFEKYAGALQTWAKDWTTDLCKAPVQTTDSDIKSFLPIGMFAYAIRNSQYAVQIYKGSELLDELPLTTDAKHCTDDCISFCNRLKIDTLPCHCTIKGIFDSLTFKLVHYDPFQQTVIRWYTSTIGQYKELLQDSSALVTGAINQILNKSDSTPVAKPQPTESIDPVIVLGKLLKNWFIDWFWYTEGKPVIDPFSQMTDTRLKTWTELSKREDSLIAIEKERLKFIDSAKIKLRPTEGHLQTLEDLQADYAAIQGRITADSLQKDAISKMINQNMATKAKTSTVLNTGKLIISHDNLVRPQKRFDAASGYQQLTEKPWQEIRTTEVPQNERPFVLVYNIDSTATLKMTEKTSVFDDQAEFTQVFNALFASADFSAISGSLSALNAFASSFNPTTGAKNGFAGSSQVNAAQEADSLLLPVARAQQAGNTSYPLNKDLFKNHTYTNTKYWTFYQSMIRWNPPFTDTFSIKQTVKKDTTEVIKSYFNVGKLRRFQLGAGIVFLFKPAVTTTIDTTGGGFRVSTANSSAAAVAGFKFYPVSSYNRDGGVLPRYWRRRFSVFGGVNIQHPLNDLYAGISYDVVPGFSLVLGKNYYVRTVYQVENGQIINTARSFNTGSTFWAATVDPTLFIQLVKFFFK